MIIMKIQTEITKDYGFVERVEVYFYNKDNKIDIYIDKNSSNREIYLEVRYNDFTDTEREEIIKEIFTFIYGDENRKLISSIIKYSTDCKITF